VAIAPQFMPIIAVEVWTPRRRQAGSPVAILALRRAQNTPPFVMPALDAGIFRSHACDPSRHRKLLRNKVL
jgi:hypothetical protein